jgi:hypothetical protein
MWTFDIFLDIPLHDNLLGVTSVLLAFVTDDLPVLLFHRFLLRKNANLFGIPFVKKKKRTSLLIYFGLG